jgi:parallel beta-helix repeat protein
MGADKNMGSMEAPWATLQHAVETLQPGDTVLVASGTYAGFRIGIAGAPNLPKTLRPEPGAKVVVNAPGPLNRHKSAIEIESFGPRITDWVLDGLEVVNSPSYGMDVRNSDRIALSNNHVHNCVGTGIFTAFANDVLIENNETDRNGEHGIYTSDSSNTPVIRGNRSHHNAASGIHMNGGLNDGPPGLIRNAIVENNVIWENGAKGGSGINCDGVDDSLIQNNVLTNNHASGISLFGADGAHSSSHNKVYNNRIVMAGNSRWVINIPDDGSVAPPVANDVQFNTLCTPDSRNGAVLVWSGEGHAFISENKVVTNRFSADNGKTILSMAQWQALGHDKTATTGCDAIIAATANPK